MIQWPQVMLDTLVRDLIDDNMNPTRLFNKIIESLWHDKEAKYLWMKLLIAAKENSSLSRYAARALFKLYYHINNTRS
jgi:hypothetical protein